MPDKPPKFTFSKVRELIGKVENSSLTPEQKANMRGVINNLRSREETKIKGQIINTKA